MAYTKPTRLRVLAPAGGFSSPFAIIRALRSLAQSPEGSWALACAGVLADRYAKTDVLLEGSGKDALRRCFTEIRGKHDGRSLRIGLSAYTCPDVAVAAIQAGCTIVALDVDAETLDIAEGVDVSECDVLLFSNLYGLADDMRRWLGKGLTLVDDACQAALSYDGKALLGARGADYGVLSFSRGKAICGLGGGAMLRGADRGSEVPADRDATSADASESADCHAVAQNIASECKSLLLSLAYFLFEMPWLYGIPARIPALGLGETHCDLNHEPQKLSRMQAAAVLAQLHDAGSRASALKHAADAWSEILTELPLVQPYKIRANEGDCPIRYPLVFAGEQQRDAALSALLRAGLGASASYPSVLNEYPALDGHVSGEDVAQARSVSKRILTLPTHVYVGERDRERTLAIIQKCI